MTMDGTRASRRNSKDDSVPPGLPAALRPWAEAFSGMPEDHLLLVGHLMAAVAPIVENQDSALTSGLDELDSFDDIAAEGPLDRLMTSELMWLKLMRGEFARRVAEGEALRRRPVFQDPATDRAVVVLLDNGPQMLGRRRLVALATLLTLGASTLRRGKRFLWAATGHIGPPWQEGISRRPLSRYINQTGSEGLDERTVAALLMDAPLDTSDERTVLWTITPKNANFGEWLPRFRFEVDEIWPDPLPEGDKASSDYCADVAVISKHGSRRTARFKFPNEQTCADTLRAPFQRPALPDRQGGGTNWAPRWISHEADGGAAVLRDNDGIVMYRRHLEPLRFALKDNNELLGVRRPGNGPCSIILRQGEEVHSIRVDQSGRVFEHGSTTLARDHPLVAEDHAVSAVPPILRLGRKAAFTIGAPNGQFYAISKLSDAGQDAISVSLAEQIEDLRLLARARSWLLCDTERAGFRAFVLVHARTGRRMFLRRDPLLEKSRRVTACEVIGESGGALLQVDGTWNWFAPAWWAASDGTMQPQVPGDAFLLRVNPVEHTRNDMLTPRQKAIPISERLWSALFWSKESGLEDWLFGPRHWRPIQQSSPQIDGRVTAMVMIGKDVMARVINENDQIDLIEFRLGSTAPKVQTGPRWWENAKCVEY